MNLTFEMNLIRNASSWKIKNANAIVKKKKENGKKMEKRCKPFYSIDIRKSKNQKLAS